MNRTTAAALIAAGVVGLIGGTVSAVVRGGSTDPAGGSMTDPAPTASTPGHGPRAVLYAGDKTIHDGKLRIRYDAPVDTPDRLVRSAVGYLISRAPEPMEPNYRIYSVSPTGTTNPVADVVGGWGLNASGDSVVGVDAGTKRLTVWHLNGRAIASAPRFTYKDYAVWQGDHVVVSVHPKDPTEWRIYTWDPATGAIKLTRDVGMTDLTASPNGNLLSGAVGSDGVSNNESNPCLRVSAAPGAPPTEWHTCDWRTNRGGSQVFSPDSSRVLAVPAQTDGFGPGQLGTFSATQGPTAALKTFLTPDLTLDAIWFDERHLLLIGATDAELNPDTGRWIRKCDLAGNCTEVARRAHGDLVMGEQD